MIKRIGYIGFTLAEVLITLGIIGVVAAMTIPTLMNKTNNAEFVSAFKKEYSVISNAWLQIIQDNGGSVAGVYAGPNMALDVFCTKLQCAKTCYTTDDTTQCFHDTDWEKLDNGAAWQSLSGASAILADGTSFSIHSFSADCTSSRYQNQTCFVMSFDTNSFKKPNVMGRDIFEVFVNQHNITPQGVAGTDGESSRLEMCSGVNTYAGASCGARILIDGGMKY